MKTPTTKPPESAKRIWRVSDLPKDRAPALYRIQLADGSERLHLLSKRKRQVVDLLIRGPVYCGSSVRISDIVHVLKRETGVNIHTEYYPGDPNTGAGAYGVYYLRSDVRHELDAKEAA